MWKEGSIKVHDSIIRYWVKCYEKSSKFGIDNGRISKLMLKRKGEIVANYDRGWDFVPVVEDAEIEISILLLEYN